MEEQYKTIEDNQDYEISNLGNVRNKKTNKILTHTLTTTGYYEVKLNGKHYKIHKLIALYFIDNPCNKKCIDHIDRNKLNNDITNLRWCSSSENCKNKTKKDGCSSKYTGVAKYRNKYESYIWDNYKKHRIGYFNTEEEAYNKRKEYIESLNNTFYNTNK